jgi:hypothetical protein
VQWRNILPAWDLELDYRYGDKIYRLRTLPSDPQGGGTNSYYDITMVTFSISRKF